MQLDIDLDYLFVAQYIVESKHDESKHDGKLGDKSQLGLLQLHKYKTPNSNVRNDKACVMIKHTSF